MNDVEHIAMVNLVVRRLESRKVLDGILADLKQYSSFPSPFGADRRSQTGGDPPLISIGPSGVGGLYQAEIFG